MSKIKIGIRKEQIMIKVLIILNYYYPYISGVSEYARILAEKLVHNGFEVTVLTSNHDKLQSKEILHGVNIIRTPVICKISKGTISPDFVLQAIRLGKWADVVNLHLPMLESGIITSFLDQNKIIATYHCDMNLTPGFFNNLIIRIMDASNKKCLKNSRFITVQTVDYASHSRIAKRFRDKFVETAAPIKEYKPVSMQKERQTIGFCGRLVEEKGIDILLKAFYSLKKTYPRLVLKIGGDYTNIAGGSIYEELKSYIDEYHIDHINFLGKISEEDMAQFYSSLDVFVLPSINSLEAFGMVQIESMLCGVPVVSSDLYGVRTIVQNTGMGVITKKGDVNSLAAGIEKVLLEPEKYIKSREEILEKYGTDQCIGIYQKIILEMVQ